ncbi:hypothetical protein WA588_001068, partial [Blastocystis sp. NMH]
MSFGYVDCSSEKTLCAEHNIRKYPTIKYVTNHVIHDYYGRNSLRSLVEVCDSLSQDSLVLVHNDAEMNSLLKQSTVLFFCVYDDSSEGQHLFHLFQNASQHLLLYTKFGATKTSLTTLPPIQPPFVIRLESEEDPQYYRLSDVAELPMMTWIRQRTLPLLPEFRGSAFNVIVRSGKPTLLFALSPDYFVDSARFDALKRLVRSLPSSMKKTFVFAYLDGNEWEQYIREFGLETSNVPCAIVMSERTGKYYSPVPIDRDVIVDYLASVMKNTRSPVLASSIRYYVSHYLNAFHRFPMWMRVVLSMSFTFALALLTL